MRFLTRVALYLGLVLLTLTLLLSLTRLESAQVQRIAYLVGNNNDEVFIMHADGTDHRRLEGQSAQSTPQWSPNGAWLTFAGYSKPTTNIIRASVNGSNSIQLTSYTESINATAAPQWSPDGQYLIYTFGHILSTTPNKFFRRFGVHTVSVDGQERHRLTQTDSTTMNPVWSPDGQWLLYVSDRESWLAIYRIRPDGTEPQRLTPLQIPVNYPTWSPDGQWIAYVMLDTYQLVRMRSDGSDILLLTDTSIKVAGAPTWSPDGEWMAFAADLQGMRADVFRIRPDGSDFQRLTDTPGTNSEPVWSPDGKWIAFVSNRTGVNQIYRMKPDGYQVERLTFTTTNAHAPTWSPILNQAWGYLQLTMAGISLIIFSHFWSRLKKKGEKD